MFHRGTVVKATLDPTLGTEQQVRRPVLVISSPSFTKATGLTRVVPISTKANNPRFKGFIVEIPEGLEVSGKLLVHQEKPLDLSVRSPQTVCELPDEVVEKVELVLVAMARG